MGTTGPFPSQVTAELPSARRPAGGRILIGVANKAMNTLKIRVLAVAGLLAAAWPARADVRLSMHDGLVTLVAKDATIRQILAEWARVGQTKIVNAEKIAGAPVSIELSDVPEKQALDILLRSVNGYLAAPRPTIAPNASRFDRILVLPAAAQPRSVSSSASAPAPPPLPQPVPPPQQRFQLAPLPPEFEEAPVQIQNPNPNLPVDPNQRQPVVNAVPPAVPPPYGAGRAGTASSPFVPAGTSVPGVVVQPPTQPPVQPQSGKF